MTPTARKIEEAAKELAESLSPGSNLAYNFIRSTASRILRQHFSASEPVRELPEVHELVLIEEGRLGGHVTMTLATATIAEAESYIAANWPQAIRNPECKAFWEWTASDGMPWWVRAEHRIALVKSPPHATASESEPAPAPQAAEAEKGCGMSRPRW